MLLPHAAKSFELKTITESIKKMKTKKLTPLTIAPVKRENVATMATNGNAIAPALNGKKGLSGEMNPFAGDDAE